MPRAKAAAGCGKRESSSCQPDDKRLKVSVQELVTRPRAAVSPAQRALLDAILRGQDRTPAIVRRAHGPDVPLSFAQERLWFLDRLQQGGTAYNLLEALCLSGSLDAAALERALGEVVRRHQVLRTDLPRGGRRAPAGRRALRGLFRPRGGPVGAGRGGARGGGAPPGGIRGRARLRPDARPALPRPAAAAGRGRARAAAVHAPRGERRRQHARALRRAVDRLPRPSRGPGVAAGGAAGAVRGLRRLAARAVRRRGGGAARWRTGRSSSPARRRCWSCPRTTRAPRCPTFRGAAVPVQVPAETLERLRELARGEGATLFMAVLAAFQVLLGRYSGSDDVVVGTPASGRSRPELEALIGLFTNTLVAAHGPGGATPRSARCCGGCASGCWAPGSTRTCRSSGWWRRCSRSAA